MLDLTILRDKVIIVAGLGKTGKATCKSLAENNITYYVYDDDNVKTDKNYKSIDDIASLSYDYLLLSPGISDNHPLAQQSLARHIPIITDLDILCLCYENLDIIAITGSNGKSTTTDLISFALRQCGYDAIACGNIGHSFLQLQQEDLTKIIIAELSSYQLHRSQFAYCQQAILLNITPDHLEWHGTMAHYITAKAKIFDMLNDSGLAICNIDDTPSRNIYNNITNHHKYPLTIDNDDIEIKNDYLQGMHNRQNMLAAAYILKYRDIDDMMYKNAISQYKGLTHRQEFITDINGHYFINDSKATNIESTIHALKSYQHIFWLMGGAAKQNADYTILIDYFTNVEKIYIYGQDREYFYHIFSQHCPCACFDNMNQALSSIMDTIKSYQNVATILLSPACASFDQFRDFEHRGDFFTALVKSYQDNTDM